MVLPNAQDESRHAPVTSSSETAEAVARRLWPVQAAAAIRAAHYLPGLALAAAVTLLASLVSLALGAASAALFGREAAPPIMALSLLIGIAVHERVSKPRFGPGLNLCSTTVLRALVSLIGLRVALGDLVHLGLELAAEIALAMTLTLATTICLARRFGSSREIGAIMGAANAICGAAATLAAANALPRGSCNRESIVLSIVLASTVSTIAMVLYPVLGSAIGFSPLQVGVLIGASVQDVPQVVGAALAMPVEAGNAAISVKMFRVLMLLPAVAAITWWFASPALSGSGRLPQVPRFAIGFLVVSGVNSMLLATPAVAAAYAPLRALLIEATGWGLIVAISAVGLETSLSGLKAQGWRTAALFLTASVVMLGASLLIAAGSTP
jgi:uncharacterized integral membrane protein (TIGR00698 family)